MPSFAKALFATSDPPIRGRVSVGGYTPDNSPARTVAAAPVADKVAPLPAKKPTGSPATSRAAGRRRRPAGPYTLELVAGLPRLAQAVSVAMAILKAAKVRRWDQLGPTLPAELIITDDQFDLLVEHSWAFRFIAAEAIIDGRKLPATTLAVCPVCGEWEITTSTASTRCRLKLGCQGRPVKTPAARKAPVEPLACAADENQSGPGRPGEGDQLERGSVSGSDGDTGAYHGLPDPDIEF